jgi:hypothetical protein
MAEKAFWKQGLIVGMIGAVTVALWFFIIDLVLGRPLFTPAALGSVLFLGVRDREMVEVTAPVVLGYTLLHLAAFIVLGALVIAIVRRIRKRPPLVLGALLVFVVLQTLFLGMVVILAEFLLGALAWWAIAVGNLLAALSMGYFVWEKDPSLQKALDREPFDPTH